MRNFLSPITPSKNLLTTNTELPLSHRGGINIHRVMFKPKEKTCRYCGERYIPYNSLQPCHTAPECAVKWLRDNPEKAKKNRLKVERKEFKELKEKTLDRKYYLKLAQTVFNTYIRLRDKDLGCVSCGTKKPVQYCAGHYWNVGSNPGLRFDEDNVHKQCNKKCNMELSANLIPYRAELIRRIGQERFDALNERRNEVKKWTIEELKEIIQTYRNKIKQITK